MIRPLCLVLACLGALTVGPEDPAAPDKAVRAMLDDFHAAKSEPDADRYFAHIAEDAVFFGTAPDERWSKAQLEELLRGSMESGYGPPSRAFARHVRVAPCGEVAWFDERLERPKLGVLRATGVALKQEGTWRVAQYHLTYPVPNEAIFDVVKLSRPHLKDG